MSEKPPDRDAGRLALDCQRARAMKKPAAFEVGERNLAVARRGRQQLINTAIIHRLYRCVPALFFGHERHHVFRNLRNHAACARVKRQNIERRCGNDHLAAMNCFTSPVVDPLAFGQVHHSGSVFVNDRRDQKIGECILI